MALSPKVYFRPVSSPAEFFHGWVGTMTKKMMLIRRMESVSKMIKMKNNRGIY